MSFKETSLGLEKKMKIPLEESTKALQRKMGGETF